MEKGISHSQKAIDDADIALASDKATILLELQPI